MTTVLVPCKSLSAGKSRLASVLTLSEREKLCSRFLSNTLQLASTVVGSSNVRVVTSDPVAQSYAMRLCIETYADGGHDLNSSLTSMINKEAADSVLILPIDLPRATRDALEPLLKVKNDVVIVPDRKQSGTNVLLLRRPVIEKFRFAFGEGSFAKHCAVAEALGNDPEIVNDDRLAFDIDNPDDYLAWRGAAR